jgi:hypothetical protein
MHFNTSLKTRLQSCFFTLTRFRTIALSYGRIWPHFCLPGESKTANMKKYLPFLSLALFFAACNSMPEASSTKTLQSTQQPTADTAGLAEFKQWRAQSELSSATQPQTQQNQTAQATPQKTVVREVRVVEKPAPTQKSRTIVQKEPSPTKTTDKTLPATDNGTATTKGNGTASTGSNDAKAPAAGQESAKKEGWSKSAKGAVIGGVGGAVLGGVINKRNRAAGAVIGGILGAGVGYGIGKVKAKKDTIQ